MANVYELYNCDAIDFDDDDGDEMLDELFEAYRSQANEYSTDEVSFNLRKKSNSANASGSVADDEETEEQTPKRGRTRTSTENATSDRRHGCDICGKLFKLKVHLKDHKLVHTGERPHKCKICERCFRQKSALTQHMTRHAKAPKPLYDCPECDASFRLKKDHLRHVKKYHTQPSRTTLLFSESYSTTIKKEAADHATESLNEGNQTDNSEWELDEEITVYPSEMNSGPVVEYIKHSPRLETVDFEDGSQSLPVISDTKSMKLEIQNLSANSILHLSKGERKKRQYACEFCSRTFRTSGHLKDHRMVHLDLRPYQCPKCDRAFRQKSALNKHVLSACGKRRQNLFSCKICSKTFRDKPALEIHEMGHDSELSSKANDHNSEDKDSSINVKMEPDTADNNEMQQSINAADDNSKQVCTPWSYTAGEKGYVCDTCSKRFRTHSHLRDHLFVHADIRPFKCTMCEKCFRQKSAMRAHMVNIHATMTYHCPVCSKKFYVKSQCEGHVRRQHGHEYVNESIVQNVPLDTSDSANFKAPEFQPKVTVRKISSDNMMTETKTSGLHVAAVRKPPNTNASMIESEDGWHLFYSGSEVDMSDGEYNQDEDDFKLVADIKSDNSFEDIDTQDNVARFSPLKEITSDQIITSTPVHRQPQPVTKKGKTIQFGIAEKLKTRRKLKSVYSELSEADTSEYEHSDAETIDADVKADPDGPTLPEKRQTRGFSCRVCSKKFQYKQRLDDHFVAQHTAERPYKCKHCEMSYASLQTLDRHAKEKHPAAKKECSICNQEFKTFSALHKHQCLKSRSTGEYPCMVCNVTFKRRKEFLKHSLIHSERLEQFACLLCDKSFPTEGGLKLHITEMHTTMTNFSCAICEQSFATNALLGLHIKRRHTAKSSLTCTFCNKVFKSNYLLKMHEKYHTGDRRFQCPHCSKRFVKYGDLASHKLTHAPPRIPCEFCPAMFRTSGALKTHMLSRHPVDPEKYKCEHCDMAFPRQAMLKQHARKHDLNRKLYSCEVCNKKFTDKHYVKMHMRLHTNQRDYVCHECGKAFIRKCDLNAHLPKHSQARPFSCIECAKTFKKESHLREHLVTHSPDSFFKCPICNEGFPTRARLKAHSFTHSGPKPRYSCDLCPKTFVSKAYVKLHMMIHNNVKAFLCTHCDKRFVRKCDLDSHMFKHTKLRPYTCEYCGNSYRNRYSLAQHHLLHTGGEIFPCAVCGKEFRKEEYLKLHMAIHTGDKPYMCEICSKSFARASCLSKHRVIHDDVKPHICSLCNKGFTQKQLLDVHMKIHAGIKDHVCQICGHAFAAKSGLKNHYQYVHSSNKPHKCVYCDKRFAFKTDRRKHMKIHIKEEQTPTEAKPEDLSHRLHGELVKSSGVLNPEHELSHSQHRDVIGEAHDLSNSQHREMLHDLSHPQHHDAFLHQSRDVMNQVRDVSHNQHRDVMGQVHDLSHNQHRDNILNQSRTAAVLNQSGEMLEDRGAAYNMPRLEPIRGSPFIPLHDGFRNYPDPSTLAAEYLRNVPLLQ